MSDFVSPFWSWFIITLTGLGIIGCFVLIFWLGGDSDTTEKPETMGHVWDGDLEEYNNPLPKWWLNMFYLTLFFSIIYLVLYPGMGTWAGVLGWTSKGQYEREIDAAKNKYDPLFEKFASTPIEELANKPEAVKMGKNLYLTYCTVCHGSDAGGGPGFPALNDTDWLYGGSPEKIKESILKGRVGNGMVAWKDALGGDEAVKNVAEYVQQLSGREGVDAAMAEKGKEKYNTICIACHGPEGKGNQMLGAPNLSDNIWLYGGSEAVIIKSIAEGRQGVMPAHEEFLGEAKSHLLATYIYSLSAKKEGEAK